MAERTRPAPYVPGTNKMADALREVFKDCDVKVESLNHCQTREELEFELYTDILKNEYFFGLLGRSLEQAAEYAREEADALIKVNQ